MAIYKCVLQGFYETEGIWMMNVLHFNDMTQGTITYQGVGDEIRTQWMPKFTQFQTNVFKWKVIYIYKLGTQEAPLPYDALNTAGTSGFQVMHPSIGLLFQLRTNLIGRAGRGRFYLPGTAENHLTRARPATGTVTQWATNGPQIKARFCAGGAGPLQIVVKHKASEGWETVTDVLLAPFAGLQRPRKPGIGI